MAGRVYTERFVSTAIVGSYVTYRVPSGFRAVVRNVDAISYTATPSEVRAFVGDALFVWHRFPAVPGEYHLETRLVAYAGEEIGGILDHAGMGLTITGYLFEDTGARAELLPETPPYVPPGLEVDAGGPLSQS